jgi:hypothetical protein
VPGIGDTSDRGPGRKCAEQPYWWKLREGCGFDADGWGHSLAAGTTIAPDCNRGEADRGRIRDVVLRFSRKNGLRQAAH